MPNWANIFDRIKAQDVSKAPPHVQALNLYAGRLTTVEQGHIVYEWDVDLKYMNPHAVFGGYLATLSDQTCSFATMSVLEDHQDFTTQDLRISFFRPVTEGTMVCEGKVVNRSRTQLFVEAEFRIGDRLVLKASAIERILERGKQA